MMPSERNTNRLVFKVRCGSTKKTLLVRRGNYSARRVVPFIERGPFGCWFASWSWGQVSWELSRWL